MVFKDGNGTRGPLVQAHDVGLCEKWATGEKLEKKKFLIFAEWPLTPGTDCFRALGIVELIVGTWMADMMASPSSSIPTHP